MNVGEWLKSEVEYGRDLADSGWAGARSAWDNVTQTEPVGSMLTRSVRASWVPTMMGAGVGALCALALQRRKMNTPAVLAVGMVGSFLGFTVGVAWETRQISSEVARGAMREIGTARDSRWLEKHPINFG
jgi:hypothetical protein